MSDVNSFVVKADGKIQRDAIKLAKRIIRGKARVLHLSYAKPKSYYNAKNCLERSLLRVERSDTSNSFETIKPLLQTKIDVIRRVLNGRLEVSNDMEKELMPIFTRQEMSALFNFSEAKRKHRVFKITMNKMALGKLSDRDMENISGAFGPLMVRKVAIVYNNVWSSGISRSYENF